MATTKAALRRAEGELERLGVAYRDHGCAEDEVEQMSSVVRARAEVEFQRFRTRREAVRGHLARAPQRFGLVLHQLVWRDEGLALLPGAGMSYGWNDGGCLLLADALAEMLGDAVEQVAVVGNGSLTGQHYLVRSGGRSPDGVTWYLDGDGACQHNELLRRWEVAERVRAPRVTRIACVDISPETPRDRTVSLQIARYLTEALYAELT